MDSIDEQAAAITAPFEPPRAKRGILILLSYALLQVALGGAIGMMLGIYFGATGGDVSDTEAFEAYMEPFQTPMGLASTLGAGIGMLIWLYSRTRHEDDGISFGFLRLLPVSGRELGLASICGAFIALVYVVLAGIFSPEEPTAVGPVTSMSMAGGWTFLAWMLFALTAPFIEEVLFRGVLLQSCLASWPRPPGSVIAAASSDTPAGTRSTDFPVRFLVTSSPSRTRKP